MDFSALIYIGTLVGIFVLVALSYEIPVGYAGLLNLGHIGLLAIGAYTSAILATRGFSFWFALVSAAVLTGIVGFFLSLPARRVRGDYYALLTLGFAFVVNAGILNLTPITRGPFGIDGIPRPAYLSDPFDFFIFVLLFLAVFGFIVWEICFSPFGMALEAVRDDEVLAESLGKRVAKLKIAAVTISAFLVGIAGSLYAYFLQYINAGIFWLDNIVWLLSAIVVGGLGSLRGAVYGMIILYAIFEGIKFFNISPGMLGSVRVILFSSFLVAMVLFKPKGFFGRVQIEE